MRFIAAAIVGLCVVTAALAQEEPPAPTESPAFSLRLEPTTRPLQRAYPERALARGVAGVVHLCCTAGADRRISCEVGVEWPNNRSFGDAGLALMNGRTLTEESFAQLQNVPGATFRVPIRWQTVPAPPELDGVIQRIDSETENLCGPGTGRAPEYIVIEGRRL